MSMMAKEELLERAARIIGGRPDNLKALTVSDIEQLMTVAQYVTDLCLNELEDRGALQFFDGMPVVPYISELSVETILTR